MLFSELYWFVFILLLLENSNLIVQVVSLPSVMVSIRSKQSGHTWPSKTSKSDLPKQSIALSSNSSTVTLASRLPASRNCPLALLLDLKFKKKVGSNIFVSTQSVDVVTYVLLKHFKQIWKLIKQIKKFYKLLNLEINTYVKSVNFWANT